ncbi:transferase [bacterium]|nr:transferase [bacterium]
MNEAKIYLNVSFDSGCVVEDFCEIGIPPRNHNDGELPTIIGKNAVIRSHTIIYAGNKIGANFQTGHGAFLREQNEIGDNVSIGTKSMIEHHVVIEDNVRVHSQVFIPEYSVLKKGCWIGPNVVLTNAKYPLSPGVKDSLVGPVVAENAIIGANSTLLPGVKIGRGAVVGAGSVVTRDVPENAVVAGNPAKVIKMRSDLPYGE